MLTFRFGWLLIALAAVAVLTVVSVRLHSSPAAAATSATFTVSNGGTHAVAESFSITVALSNVTFDTNSPKWVGYDLELDYDPLVLNATAVAPTLCPASAWGSTSLIPGVVTGCFLPGGSTAIGVIETVTFTCQGNGTTSLHLPGHHAGAVGSGNGLFDGSANDFSMTLVDTTVICGTGVNAPTPTATAIPATPTPTSTPGFTGMATISVSNGGTHAIGEPFTVATNLSHVVFGTSRSWAVYSLELDYDANILVVTGAAPTLCVSSDWNLMQTTPYLVAGCILQNSTSTDGVLETISFRCTANGTSALHIADPPFTSLGDVDGTAFQVTLQDSSVVCGTGVNGPTPTIAAPTATATPTTTPTGGPGAATISMVAPAGAQPLNMPFFLRTNLSAFSAGSRGAWAGYDLTVVYDPGIVEIDYVSPTLCPPQHWAYAVMNPFMSTGCFGLQSMSTGVLDTIVAKCINDGTSAFHIVPDGSPSNPVFFNSDAVAFPVTFQDASVACDRHVDDDGDACGSTREPALGLDPLNPWDFYSAPVPSLLAAPNPRLVFKDGIVAATDAQAVFAYFKAGAKTGKPVYEQDLNGNGVADGIEYDRSVVGPAHSGPPDGAVSAQDAQLAFAQFRLSYRC